MNEEDAIDISDATANRGEGAEFSAAEKDAFLSSLEPTTFELSAAFCGTDEHVMVPASGETASWACACGLVSYMENGEDGAA